MSEQLDRIEGKVDTLALKVISIDDKVGDLDKGLAVHKAHTSKLSLLLGGIASVLVAIAAVLLKGCV